ncbi:FUSC family membrane protein [Mucilaginibacter sp. PAMB04168]|uniref:FUSC family membrane protein n=1 Tax=Mucilaginibacter sp. PAMB04168 TaxID=3138567 RepID=UPI0031F6C83B
MIWLTNKKKLSFFLSSEFFTDALRTTISIFLPVWLLFSLGKPDIAVAVGIGTLLTSLTDSSGTYSDKKLGSLVSIGLFFFVTLVTSFCWQHPWLLGIMLFMFCFSFAMLTTFGNRFSMIGTTAIALCIFISGMRPLNGFEFSAYILTGGVCYYMISLLQSWLWPFRSLYQAVTECIKATSTYMQARTAFYNRNIPLEECYYNIIPLHTLVNEKHENVRDLLLRDKLAMRSDNKKGQLLLRIATQVIDLYEHITTVHFDYQHFRDALGMSGAPEVISRLIEIMALDIDQAGNAFYLNKSVTPNHHSQEVAYLHSRLQYIIEKENANNQALLRHLKHNIEDVSERITRLKALMAGQEEIEVVENEALSYPDFLTYRPRTFSQFKMHLNFRSPVFRFSLRLAVACTFAYILTCAFPLGGYSYWIMLTVIVIMKPAYSITRQRNKQRLIGTLTGVAVGLLLIAFINSTAVLLTISLFLLLGFFTFSRTKYALSVMFITPMVMICLHIYSEGKTAFIFERIYDTLIGCAIALVASYIFPVWEKHNLSRYLNNVLDANYAYLDALYQKLSGETVSYNTYKLLRKNVYTRLADFSAAFQRLLLEPKRMDIAVDHLQRFQALNHQLYGAVASLNLNSGSLNGNSLHRIMTAQALNSLRKCMECLNDEEASKVQIKEEQVNGLNGETSANDTALNSQFNSIVSTVAQLQTLCQTLLGS